MISSPLIETLKDRYGHPDDALFIRTLPEREAQYAAVPESLHPTLKQYLEREGIRPYLHQAESFHAAHAGEDIILTTPTASGKTLAFALPIFDRLLSDPSARALLLYPTKALARDQHAALEAIDRATGTKAYPAVYDGDTPRDVRPKIRERSRIIISNMHEIHHILPWRRQWADFFGEVAFVVIDEAHRYRGVFGSHIALLMRRLQRVLTFYDADPAFILASATLGNPEEFGGRLIGRSCRIISGDGAPQNRRTIIFYNPYERNPTTSLTTEVTNLLTTHVQYGHQTICFASSRRMAEIIARMTREKLAGDPKLAERISAYRAGYLADERREIEAALKDGTLRGIISTNALELGVDIGTLDAVLMAGYPGTTLSFWQQAGRAGRSVTESVVTMVARYDPIDQYYMHHPDRFFSVPPEHAAIDMSNPMILSGHIICAASEIPLCRHDMAYFGQDMDEHIQALRTDGILAKTTKGYVYAGSKRPSDLVNLSGSASGGYRIIQNGHIIETMDAAQAYREAYVGAILLHQGESFIVRSVDREDRIIRVEAIAVDYLTRTLSKNSVSVDRVLTKSEFEEFSLSSVDVTVTEQILGYRIVRYDSVIGSAELDVPPLSFSTQGLLIACSEELFSGFTDPDGALHATEHVLIAAMPGVVICDRNDIGGISTSYHPAAQGPAIIIYDGYTGGAGLSVKAYELIERVVTLAETIISECRCIDGCPACIFSPKCGNDNKPLDKAGATALLHMLKKAIKD